jgi:hypothetical protein
MSLCQVIFYYILKADSVRISNGLHVGCERKRIIQCDFKFFGLNSWKLPFIKMGKIVRGTGCRGEKLENKA